ncbi:hypothetical protein RhiJN_18488 [Ceratobasidium sp. AG-Ba]|nr:hypothetical protein RhiJN_18488 [Ceratobasidium sp. AG-Ba]
MIKYGSELNVSPDGMTQRVHLDNLKTFYCPCLASSRAAITIIIRRGAPSLNILRFPSLLTPLLARFHREVWKLLEN